MGQNCLSFNGPEVATLYDPTSATGLLLQADGSYTAVTISRSAPFTILGVMPDYQDYIGSCLTPPTTAGNLPPVMVSPPPVGAAWQVAAWGNFVNGSSLPGVAATATATPEPYVSVRVMQSGKVIETNYAVANGAITVGTGDFNNDGNADLAVLYSGNGKSNGGVSILLGNGDGTFKPAVNYPIAANLGNAAIADLNGDGNLDIVVTSGDPSAVHILLGNGNGAFSAGTAITTIPGQAGQVLAGDFNGDGKVDLAVTSLSNGGGGACTVSILRGNGNGTFQLPQNSPAGVNCAYLAAGDFNKDGKLDLAVTDVPDSLVNVLLGSGTGLFGVATPYNTTSSPDSLIITDFNHDGILDIVTGTGTPGIIAWDFGASDVAVLVGVGDGTFKGGPAYYTPSPAYSIAAGDLTGDGRLSLVTANHAASSLTIMVNQGEGTFALRGTPYSLTSSNGGVGPTALALADLNADGHTDVVVANSAGSVAVGLGKGDGTFQSPAYYTTGTNSVSVAIGDLNGDGKPDLVVANKGNTGTGGGDNGSVSVLLGAGGGAFYAANDLTVGVAPDFVVLQDVNGDGILDLVVLDYGVAQGSALANPGSVSVSLGKGDGTFKTAVSYAAMYNPTAVAVGDVNGDGIPDLVVTTAGVNHNGMVGVYLGNGDGTFQHPAFYPGAVGMTDIVIADMHEDGKLDLVITSCCGATQPGYLLGNGDGTFQPLVYFNGGPSPYFLAVADYNGDGKPDLAIADLGSGSGIGYVTIRLNTTATTFVTKSATAGQIAPFAANSIVAAYGSSMAVGTAAATTVPLGTSLDGTTVTVTDSAGVTRTAALFYVSPTQVNYSIPGGTAPGTATVTITNKNGTVQTATIQISAVSPGVFDLNKSGLVAALVLPVLNGVEQTGLPVFQMSGSKVAPLPIDVAAANSQFYLEIYGTGIRSAKTVTATVGNVNVPVLFFGPAPGYTGEDQVNIGPLPVSLAGMGSVNIILIADGQAANTVNVTIQ